MSPRAAIRIVIVNSFDSGPMYAEYLRSRDFVVHWFSSPDAAQSQLCDIAPDVIVTDFVFHGGSTDGPSFIRSVRTMSGVAEVPIVVVSGYVRAVDRMVAREAGATLFLHKPCLPDQLLTAIWDVVACRQRGEEMPWNWEPEVPAAAPMTGDRRRAKSGDPAIGA